MIEHNVITAAIAIVGLFMVAWGYLPLFWMGLADWARWMFVGVGMLALAILLRQAYWDLAQYIVGDDWAALRKALGGQEISSVFNLAVIASVAVLLHARLLLIPEPERDDYRIWNAWTHPCRRCVFQWRKPKSEGK